MMAWCDYCQKNTLSVAIQGSADAQCASCGQKLSLNYSKIDLSDFESFQVPGSDQRQRRKLSAEEAKLETQKYLTPEILASFQSENDQSSAVRKETSANPVGDEERERLMIQEIESLEKAVRNLVHSSSPGVPKPKAMKVRPAKNVQTTSKSKPKASSQSGPKSSFSEPNNANDEIGFGAGAMLGDRHLRVDMGHVPKVEMGRPADSSVQTSDSNRSSESENLTSVQSLQGSIFGSLPSRSYGLRLSSLAISLSWCVQLLLGFSYFHVMPTFFSGVWILAQTIGTASLGYILASQIWDTDRNEPAKGSSNPPQEPAYSKNSKAKPRSSKLV